MAAFERLADLICSHLLWTSLRAAVLVVIIALVLRMLPRLPAAARCALWWIVALQVVLGLAWQLPIRLSLPPPPAVAATIGQHVVQIGFAKAAASINESSHAVRFWQRRVFWREGLLALWILGTLAQAPALVASRRRLRALLRDVRPPDPALQHRCMELATRAGLRRCPRLLISDQVEAPLVAGCWRPLILWPGRQALSADETSLALAHELAHLKRGDLWLGFVPALARRLLFFHPLVRWAVREYAVYREAACDAAAMRGRACGTQEYGALLLRLGVSGARVTGISATSETFRHLKLRLMLLHQPASAMLRARVWILIVAIAALGALPYRVVAANRPAANPAKAGVSTANGSVKSSAQCAVKADDIVEADDVRFCGAHFLMYTGSAQSGRGAVLFDKDEVIIAGDHTDVVSAKQFYRRGARLLWLRRDGKEYVTRDASILDRAEALVQPVVRTQTALLDRRHKLLDQRNQLREMESALLGQQGKLGILRRGMSGAPSGGAVANRARQTKLEAHIQAQQAQIEALQSSLHAQQVDLQKIEQAASGKSGDISDGLAELAADALASGTAQPIDR